MSGDPFHDRLWGVRQLAAYLGYSESTVAAMASREPEKLPPRVAPLGRPRWEPNTVRAWAVTQSRPPSKKGRPRNTPRSA